MKYNFRKIEKEWQKIWQEEGVYEPDLEKAKKSPRPPNTARGKPFYNLMMFPYPSAEGLHVGNMYAFVGSDIYGRLKRMQGYNVFEPIGLDGFGIHSENYALKIGAHPADQAKKSEKRFYEQLRMIGNGFAWNEKLETYNPEYYRWTQWIFVQMFKQGLAYRKKAMVNWCPSCKTVLADEQVLQKSKIRNPKFETNSKSKIRNHKHAVAVGICERCETQVIKKELEQWFFKITDYAERLLKDLDKIDWSEKVKVAQRNWIGQSHGALVDFQIQNTKYKIQVFTTRPDTLFGATYMVLSPEHELIQNLESRIRNLEEVKKYIKKAKKKTDEDRIADTGDSLSHKASAEREKTGVKLKGIKAINPATKEEIPIWVADYVLGDVGTGAIMAVPAHDQRDFEFANSYNLPIKQVIAPYFYDDSNPPRDGKKRVERVMVQGIVKHWQKNEVLQLKWKSFPWKTFVIGGAESGESLEEAVRREVIEETGYKNFKSIRRIGLEMRSEWFAEHKNENRYAKMHAFLIELADGAQDEIVEEEKQKHDVAWIPFSSIPTSYGPIGELEYIWENLNAGIDAYTKEGVVINSGEFSEKDSERAKWEITKFVGGKKQTNYRLRDWLISRQRYWGPPIPLVFCETCKKQVENSKSEIPKWASPSGFSRNPKSKEKFNKGELENPGWIAVPEEDLPVKLPRIKNFRPIGKEGESPLASVKSFYETKCPRCGGKARRETDVSDTFLDSSWYYYRYPSTRSAHRGQVPWDPEITKRWLPVDMYIGGSEHSVLHLLYTRFITKVFHDWGLIDFSAKGGSPPKADAPREHALGGDEPFKKFRAHGLLIKEGAKMSKSKGNVVNPDKYIEKFGTDVLRMYLMFIAPFEDGGDFRDSGILGIRRFLDRVWKLCRDANIRMHTNDTNTKLERLLHKTIKKVTEDIENLKYNTAISALMVLLNEIERHEVLDLRYQEAFLKLLAPFAPHITEEIWRNVLGHKTSIHLEKWPEHDSKLIKEEKFELVIQVNGKTRDTITTDKGISKNEAEELALGSEKVKKHLGDKKIKKIIFVKDRLISFVVDKN